MCKTLEFQSNPTFVPPGLWVTGAISGRAHACIRDIVLIIYAAPKMMLGIHTSIQAGRA